MMEQHGTTAEEIAAFTIRVQADDLAGEVLDRRKRSVLETLACGIGALGGQSVRRVREMADEFGGTEHCTLVRWPSPTRSRPG